jgi:hypothetical protein
MRYSANCFWLKNIVKRYKQSEGKKDVKPAGAEFQYTSNFHKKKGQLFSQKKGRKKHNDIYVM